MKTSIKERRAYLREAHGADWWVNKTKEERDALHAEAEKALTKGKVKEPKVKEPKVKEPKVKESNYVRVERAWMELRDKWLSPSWKFEYGNSVNTRGVCYPTRQLIRLSRKWVEEQPWERVLNTLTHEVSHGIVGIEVNPKTGRRVIHGTKWRETHISLGGTGERCSKSALPE